jgi:hypothetical protein
MVASSWEGSLKKPVSVFLPIINPQGLTWDRTLVSAERWHDPTLFTKQTCCLSSVTNPKQRGIYQAVRGMSPFTMRCTSYNFPYTVNFIGYVIRISTCFVLFLCAVKYLLWQVCRQLSQANTTKICDMLENTIQNSPSDRWSCIETVIGHEHLCPIKQTYFKIRNK